MRAIGLDFDRREVAEREVDAPRIAAPGEVLWRVAQVGVCGTDRELAAFRLGSPPPGRSFLVLGHEAVGQVVEVGPAVRLLRPGDWVAPMIRRPCAPHCASCARRRPDLCTTGGYGERGISGLDGYLGDVAVDPEASLVRIDGALAEVAVLAEPLSVVEKAIDTAMHYRQEPARTALVIGAGPVGLLAAMALRLRGLEVSLHSLEPPEHPRARLAERAGARYLARPEPADVVLEATGA
ncbi:MAG: alcohol dehydrogenase catalytic domain-containing protein, partial [Bryobacteraceae bacterium]